MESWKNLRSLSVIACIWCYCASEVQSGRIRCRRFWTMPLEHQLLRCRSELRSDPFSYRCNLSNSLDLRVMARIDIKDCRRTAITAAREAGTEEPSQFSEVQKREPWNNHWRQCDRCMTPSVSLVSTQWHWQYAQKTCTSIQLMVLTGSIILAGFARKDKAVQHKGKISKLKLWLASCQSTSKPVCKRHSARRELDLRTPVLIMHTMPH